MAPERPTPTRSHRPPAWRLAACFAALGVTGCHWLNPDKCPDLPCGAISAPPGASIDEWLGAQASRAEADDFMVYEADWVAGGAVLSPAAQRRVAVAGERVACGESPLVFAPSGDAQLDADRRFALASHLAESGWPGLEESIQPGGSAALSLLGREAPAATRQLLNERYLPNSPFAEGEGPFGGGAIANPFGAPF